MVSTHYSYDGLISQDYIFIYLKFPIFTNILKCLTVSKL